MDNVEVATSSVVEETTINVVPLNLPTLNRKDNLKVKAREVAQTVASLRAQVKELEQQRDFLITWKVNMCNGINDDDNYVDVEFQGVDGDRVKAHKVILASKSNEFQAMFRSSNGEKQVINLDMPYEALKAFINFFYTGSVSFNVIMDHLSTLLHVAHKYNVPFLASVCEDLLVKKLTKENVISTFEVSKKHCSNNCRAAVLEKASRLGDLSRFEEYNVFTQSNPGLLLEFYEQLTNQAVHSPSKKLKLSRENGVLERNDANVLLSNEDNAKFEIDEGESNNDNMKTEANPTTRPYMQLNGVSQFATPLYWHGTPVLGHPFHPLGFEGPKYPHSRDMSMLPRSPYGVPSFVSSMFPRGFLRGTTTQRLGPPETPFVEETFSRKNKVHRREDTRRAKIPLKQQKRCLFRGVKTTHNRNKKFIATITIKGQHIVLGKCHTEEEAGCLYDRAAFVIGRKTNNELPDDMKEELKGISWDDFMASLQEVTALEKIHQEMMDDEGFHEVDYNEDQIED